jgi:hypothetical protein
VAFDNVLRLAQERNFEILRIDTKTTIRRVSSGKHKAGEVGKNKTLICRCPTENCSGTISLSKERDILERKPRCRRCSVTGSKKEDKKIRLWHLLTTEIDQATTMLAKANPHLFIREEGTLTKKNGLAKRVILRCPTEGCQETVSTTRVSKPDLLHSRCKKCADEAKKKRPYERTYNQAKKRYERTKSNGISIMWKLSYQEFVFLCQIPNCHYCHIPLNRAEYKSDLGTTTLLLDRKDSNQNYTIDNCVPCCPDCNFTKNERISYDEMVLIMKHRQLWVEDKEIPQL